MKRFLIVYSDTYCNYYSKQDGDIYKRATTGDTFRKGTLSKKKNKKRIPHARREYSTSFLFNSFIKSSSMGVDVNAGSATMKVVSSISNKPFNYQKVRINPR